MVQILLEALERPDTLIRHVADRPGHDRRYSLDLEKIMALGWQPSVSAREAISRTARWYQDNEWWWRKLRDGEFRSYYAVQYGSRLDEDESGSL